MFVCRFVMLYPHDLSAPFKYTLFKYLQILCKRVCTNIQRFYFKILVDIVFFQLFTTKLPKLNVIKLNKLNLVLNSKNYNTINVIYDCEFVVEYIEECMCVCSQFSQSPLQKSKVVNNYVISCTCLQFLVLCFPSCIINLISYDRMFSHPTKWALGAAIGVACVC